MNEEDLGLRIRTYGLLVELGRAPTAREVARAIGSTEDDVRAGWGRLHDLHALVLDRQTREIRMVTPFSAVPTSHRVHAAGRWWYANCAWDAFGICSALGTDGRIETTCADCGDPIGIGVREGEPIDEHLLFHCLVPAARWWDDIGFT